MLQHSTLFIIQQPLLINSHAFLERINETCEMSEAKSTTRLVSTALVRFQQLNRPLVRFQQRDHKKRSLAGAPCDPCPQPAHAASLYHLRVRMQRRAVAHARELPSLRLIASACSILTSPARPPARPPACPLQAVFSTAIIAPQDLHALKGPCFT